MAEKGEAPKILVASKGMSIEEMKAGVTLPERGVPTKDFWHLQDELFKFKDHPDKNKEQELKLHRARLLNEAKEVGVFDTIKPLLVEIQTKYPYGEAYKRIGSDVDVNGLETEARGINGWKDEFAGMVEHYRDGALRNMELAFFEATGNDADPRVADLKREKELLGWGAPPLGLELLVDKNPNQGSSGIDTHALATDIAEAQGLLSPKQYLEDYRDAEEFLKAPFQIVPGAEPRFWPILNDKEKQEWFIRSTLVVAAYKKSMATGTDKLYMDEMRELAVDLNKRALKILFGSRPPVYRDGKIAKDASGKTEYSVEYEGVEGVLPAVGIYSTIIGDEKFLSHKNPEDLSLKSVFCDILTDKKLSEEIAKDYGEEALEEFRKEEDTLYKSCPDSMYPHDKNWGTSISQESFYKLRLSIRHWLATKGRDLLLTDKESQNREAFFSDKKNALTELKSRARDAEQMGWNFIYSTSLLENFDSRDYRPAGTKRHGPSNYWSLFQWVPMHLQERFEQKVLRDNESDSPQAKEEWAGSLGTWAIKNYTAGNWSERLPDGRIKVNIPKLLPNTLIRSPLHPSMYQTAVRQGEKNTYTNESAEKNCFFTTFNKIGNDVLFDTSNVTKDDIESRINWAKETDSPFVPFIFDEMRWADVIQQVFKKGQASRLDLRDPSEAVRNLRLTNEQRVNLLIAFYGADPKSSNLKTKESFIDWNFRLRAIKEYFPNYFLER